MNFSFHGFNQIQKKRLEAQTEKVLVTTETLSLEEHKNVVFFPHQHFGRLAPRYACLYSESGERLDLSCLWRGLNRGELITQTPKKVPVDSESLDRDSRNYIYIGPIFNHYGHFLTEYISRLWPLIKDTEKETKKDFSNYYFLYHGMSVKDFPAYVKDFIKYSGVDASRFVSFDQKMILNSVSIPCPSFFNKAEANAVHTRLPEIVAKSILQSSKESETEQPLYLSRRLIGEHRRLTKGESELEDFLIGKGVNVQHFQFLTFEEQIRLINRHKTIIGAIGSAMHNILFDLSLNKQVVYLCTPLINSNFFIIDVLKKTKASYLNCLELKQEENPVTGGKKNNANIVQDRSISLIESFV